MRQIYTSPRHENVDRVVQLLNDNGIETTLTNRRGYRGSDWKRFSYSQRDNQAEWPQVWIVNSDDQLRAREVLREVGIDPGARAADAVSYAACNDPASIPEPAAPLIGPERHRAVASRMRMGVLAIVAVAALLLIFKSCSMQ